MEILFFLVYVIFSTGDSFHHHSGYDCRLIDVFEHKENEKRRLLISP